MTQDIERIIFTEDALRERVHELGKSISADYAGKKLLVVGVLKGAFVFMADLIRQITIPCQIDFITASSYRDGSESSGSVEIVNDVRLDVAGCSVLLAEDILDTGRTLNSLKQLMLSRGAADVRVAALLDKPSRRVADIMADYKGFEVGDEFIVGYGLDYAERYRNIPYVAALKPSVYGGQ